MERLEKTIEVDVPVSTAYNQWTQFEDFPRFMEGVEEVRQLDDRHLRWVAEIGGVQKSWEAEIIEQLPDQRIVWQSQDGPYNAGAVSFAPVDEGRTRASLTIEYEPENLGEKIGDALGFVSRRVEGDLKRFKEFIEARGQETGAWRGKIAS